MQLQQTIKPACNNDTTVKYN